MSRAAKASASKPRKKTPAKRSMRSNCSDIKSKITLKVATLKDLKALATGRKNQPIKGECRTLVYIASKLQRDRIYREVEQTLATHEIESLMPHGGRPWQCAVKVSDPPTNKRGPLFRYRKGKLELASLPQLVSKIIQEQPEEDPLSQEAADSSRYPQVQISRTWISPLNLRYTSRKAAMEASAELVRRDNLIQKLLLGIGARGNLLVPKKTTKKLGLEVGKYRFERDGLWVVGQEEQWQMNRQKALLSANESNEKNKCVEKEVAERNEISVEKDGDLEKITDRATLSSGSLDNNDNNHNSYIYSNGSGDCINNISSSQLVSDTTTKATSVVNVATNLINNGMKQIKGNQVSSSVSTAETGKLTSESIATAATTTEQNNSTIESAGQSQPSAKGHPCSSNENPLNDEMKRQQSTEGSVSMLAPAPRKTHIKKKGSTSFQESRHWRLAECQINMCYKACMEHYERVVYTVKARGLHEELAAGFDVLRERGRGRFDLTLDAFDTPQFSFLTSSEMPWMEAVKTILGKDAVLIHKGCFLSLPGSETQKYHQDGVHLNNHAQKRCHAVNVFVPLVDLSMANGPTEFCLGSHILGHESFRREVAETPTPLAGSAIIFDYRLGHRGLGNSSQECRPILYLTYTHGGSNFKDTVNFSTKRYKRLGDIAERPLSREERVSRRTTAEKSHDDSKVYVF